MATERRWTERRGVTVALALVALVVWGALGRALWIGVGGEDEETVGPASTRPVTSDRLEQTYVETGPDPFTPTVSLTAAPDTASVEAPTEAPPVDDTRYPELPMPPMERVEPSPPEPPQWRFRGRVGAQAILEAPDGVTVLAQVGDGVGEGRVVAIEEQLLVIEEYGQRYTFLLE